MNARAIFFSLISCSFLCAIALPSAAQPPKHAASARRADAADEANRKQLAAYLAEFQGNPDDTSLRGKIVVLAKSLDPAPAIPELAQDDYAKAVTQMSAASSADDFDTVAHLFEQVGVQAPWYADAYFNAASAYVRANEYPAARRNLSLYLSAVRPGVDTRNVEQLRRELEHKQSLQFQQVLQQFIANPTDAARLRVIQLAQAMETQPEIPEEARGHYVMAVVYGNSAADGADFERAIAEYKAALLNAPWWGEAYKKLAGAQTLAGHYEDAISSLIFYQAVDPADARSTQDEIYRLKALGQRATEEQAQQQTEEQRRMQIIDQEQKKRASSATMQFTSEGRWFQVIGPSGYFVGGEANPNCDYLVKLESERSIIKNTCMQPKRSIEDIEIQPKQLRFKLLGRDAAFPFAEVIVTLGLSPDGQYLDGRAITYDKKFHTINDQPVRWMRRKQ